MAANAFQTSNPVFTKGAMLSDWSYATPRANTMTVQGTALKSLLLLVVLTGTATFAWNRLAQPQMLFPLMGLSAIVGIGVCLLTMFKPTAAPFTGPIYAAVQGLFLGSLSSLLDQRFPGLPKQAVGLSFATLAVMLFIYGTGIVRVTDRFASVIVGATGALCLLYFVSFIMRMFGAQIPYIHGSGPIGIGFSVFVVGLAAFNLLLDFEYIARASRSGSPKLMEWYGAFGLMVTMVWLYIEIINLLLKLQSRD